MPTSVITRCNRTQFKELLENNPGVIILKFTATWCRPCQECKEQVYSFFSRAPSNVVCLDLDVDQNADIYSYFKRMKQVNGIPAFLGFFQGNVSYAPNIGISGSHPDPIGRFFQVCYQSASRIN
jgi:thiol:disulfide interchange protein